MVEAVPNFVAITGNQHDGLYAVCNQGFVWFYDFANDEWKRLYGQGEVNL